MEDQCLQEKWLQGLLSERSGDGVASLRIGSTYLLIRPLSSFQFLLIAGGNSGLNSIK